MVFVKAALEQAMVYSVSAAKAGVSLIFSLMEGVLFPTYCVGCGVWDELVCEQCRAFMLGLPGPDALVLSEPSSSQHLPPSRSAIASWRLLALERGQERQAEVQAGEKPQLRLPRRGVGGVEKSQTREASEGDAVAGCFGVDVPHWVLAEYAGVVRNLVVAAKHRSDVKLEPYLLEAGYELGKRMCESALSWGWEGRTIRVIPAPSRLRRRLSGREVAVPLAMGVARALSESLGGEIWMQEFFRLRWGAGSQAGKNGIQRKQGRVGTMQCLRSYVEGEVIVFVDDIVTTGATIREMARALGRSPDAVASLCGVRGS